MGSPWPCATVVADTSSVHSYHPFQHPVIGNVHQNRQDSAPFFGVAYASVDQDSAFFDNNEEDLNGVSSNSSGPRPFQRTRSVISSVQETVSNIVRGKDLSNPAYFNPHCHNLGDTVKRYSAQNSALPSTSLNQEYEPARKRVRFRGNCVISLREIPTWNIYYYDQRRHLVKFSDKNKGCARDPNLCKRVSLSFYKNVLAKLDVDAVVYSMEEYSKEDAGRNSGAVGSVVATVADELTLPARYIFHVNGPDLHTYTYEEVLRRCYENCLNLLIQRELRTIAIPCISTTRKGIPNNIAAGIALSTVRHFLEQHKDKVDRVVFCLNDNKKDIDIYLRLMQIYFPVE